MDRQTDRGTTWETAAHIVAEMLGPISLVILHTCERKTKWKRKEMKKEFCVIVIIHFCT